MPLVSFESATLRSQGEHSTTDPMRSSTKGFQMDLISEKFGKIHKIPFFDLLSIHALIRAIEL